MYWPFQSVDRAVKFLTLARLSGDNNAWSMDDWIWDSKNFMATPAAGSVARATKRQCTGLSNGLTNMGIGGLLENGLVCCGSKPHDEGSQGNGTEESACTSPKVVDLWENFDFPKDVGPGKELLVGPTTASSHARLDWLRRVNRNPKCLRHRHVQYSHRFLRKVLSKMCKAPVVWLGDNLKCEERRRGGSSLPTQPEQGNAYLSVNYKSMFLTGTIPHIAELCCNDTRGCRVDHPYSRGCRTPGGAPAPSWTADPRQPAAKWRTAARTWGPSAPTTSAAASAMCTSRSPSLCGPALCSASASSVGGATSCRPSRESGAAARISWPSTMPGWQLLTSPPSPLLPFSLHRGTERVSHDLSKYKARLDSP